MCGYTRSHLYESHREGPQKPTLRQQKVTKSLFCGPHRVKQGIKLSRTPLGFVLMTWGQWVVGPQVDALGGDREVEGLRVPQVTRVQTVTDSSEG